MMTWAKISSLDEIDFDDLFAGTLPAADATPGFWPSHIDSLDRKREHTLETVTNIFNVPGSANFKVSVDGAVVAALFGFMQGGQYIVTFALMRDDANGSRSYIHRPEWFQTIKDFAASEGATSGGMYFFPESHTLPSAKIIYGASDNDLTYFDVGGKIVILMKLW